MKTEITPAHKKEVLERALAKVRGSFHNTICSSIFFSFDLDMCNFFIKDFKKGPSNEELKSIQEFFGLIEFKPIGTEYRDIWFELTPFGQAERVKILELLISEIKI